MFSIESLFSLDILFYMKDKRLSGNRKGDVVNELEKYISCSGGR
jgi:hypothetical protein